MSDNGRLGNDSMARRGRRGFTLIEVLIWLPIVAAVFTMSAQLAVHAMRAQGRETALIADDARLRDVLRRVQRDAAAARSARVPAGQSGNVLIIERPGQVVVYQVYADRVVRAEQAADETAVTYAWPMQRTAVAFLHEAVVGRAGLVWIRAEQDQPMHRGDDRTRVWAAAAAVASEGVASQGYGTR